MKKLKFERLLCNEYGCELINNKGKLYFRRKGGSQKVPYITKEANDISDREAKDILKGLNFPQNTINDILG